MIPSGIKNAQLPLMMLPLMLMMQQQQALHPHCFPRAL